MINNTWSEFIITKRNCRNHYEGGLFSVSFFVWGVGTVGSQMLLTEVSELIGLFGSNGCQIRVQILDVTLAFSTNQEPQSIILPAVVHFICVKIRNWNYSLIAGMMLSHHSIPWSCTCIKLYYQGVTNSQEVEWWIILIVECVKSWAILVIWQILTKSGNM